MSFMRLVMCVAISAAAGCTSSPEVDVAPTQLDPPFSLETARWSVPYSGPRPGPPRGARRATLTTDPRDGGETYYAHFPAGERFDLHWHAHAEYAVVLRGSVTHILGSQRSRLAPGDYVTIPPKVAHGWEPETDVYLLIRREGPADFNYVDTK